MIGCFRIDLRLAACALTLLGSSLLSTVFRFYYVRVFLNCYDLSARWLNFAQLFFIVANIFIEPFLGFLQDFGCARFCKNRRKVILFGGPLLAGAFLISWFSPYDPKNVSTWVPGVHLVLAMFFYNTFQILAMSAYYGLFVEQSSEHSKRVTLYKYGAIARFMGNLVILPLEKISGSLRNFPQFQYCCLAIAGTSAICFIVTGLTAPDSVVQNSVESGSSQRTNQCVVENPLVAAGRVAGHFFRNRDFMSALASNLCRWMRIHSFWNFLSIHTEILVSPSLLPPGSFRIALFYQLCVLIPLLISAFVVSPLTRRYGSYWMIQISNVLTWVNSAIALLLVKWTGYNIAIAFLFIESILQIFQFVFVMIFSEVVDEDAKKHKEELPPSTFIYTLNWMVARSSIGLMPILVTFLLNLGGYSAYKMSLESAPPNLKLASFLTAVGLPAFLALLGFLTFLPYRIRRTS